MKKHVLVFPCGSEIGLEINKSLAKSIHVEVFGASSVDDHGKFVFENYIPGLPYVESENFIDELNKLICEHKIDFVFPAHDRVVLKLAQNAHLIKAGIITSPKQTCEIARSKLKTYQTLENVVRTPLVYQQNSVTQFPVFLKPDAGQGSKGCLKVDSKKELQYALDKEPDLLILEYLPGKEYTVDCFTNKNGKLLYAQGRQRGRISNGISVNSKPFYDEEFVQIADRINDKLKFRGVWFFQLKENAQGKLCLLEIAPRVAGTMALSRMTGVNLPLLSCFDFMDTEVCVLKNNYDIEIDRALENKYKIDIDYETVYVDFDDCLIINDKVNTQMIGFLYNAINNGKKIVLITKHKDNLDASLEKYKIGSMFDSIIHLKEIDKKYLYIKDKNAIFIDDSFAQRKEVADNLNIPTFTPEMINEL